MKALDITGRRFGRLTAVCFVESVQFKYGWIRFWRCRCDCGSVVDVRIASLTCGATRSCGCWGQELTRNGRRTTHSATNTAEFSIWIGIRQRCSKPSNKHYQRYGARGITVCERWETSFENFLSDMGPRPSPRHSVERIDNDKGYYLENCKWGLAVDQANNRRNNRLITFNGQTKTIAQWARDLGIHHNTIRNRLNRGKSVEDSLNANHP